VNTGIYVGVSKEAVREARLAIMDILKCAAAADAVKLAALDALIKMTGVSNTTIHDVQIGFLVTRKMR